MEKSTTFVDILSNWGSSQYRATLEGEIGNVLLQFSFNVPVCALHPEPNSTIREHRKSLRHNAGLRNPRDDLNTI